MKKQLIYSILLCLILQFLNNCGGRKSTVSSNGEIKATGQIELFVGDMEYREPLSQNWKQADIGTKVEEKSEIRNNSPNGYIEMYFPEHIRIDLLGMTFVKFHNFPSKYSTNNQVILMELIQGKARVKIEKTPPQDLIFITPTVRILIEKNKAKDVEFGISVLANENIAVKNGLIQVENTLGKFKPVIIQNGQTVSISANSSPSPPETMKSDYFEKQYTQYTK